MLGLWVPIEDLRIGTLPKDSAGDSIGDCSALAILVAAREYSPNPDSISYTHIANDIISEKQRNRKDFSGNSDSWFTHHCDIPIWVVYNLIEKYTGQQLTSTWPFRRWRVWEVAKACQNHRLVLLEVPNHIISVRFGKIHDTWNSRMEPVSQITLPWSDHSDIMESLRKYRDNPT